MSCRKKAQQKKAVSSPFRATRVSHATEAAEDYTELIQDLIDTIGEARTGRIAARLGISHVTALRTLRRLARDGYVITGAHKPVELTPKGVRTAKRSRERHKTLVRFLVKLGVPERTAEIDAEGIEHHISPVTLEAIKDYLEVA